RPRPPRRFAMAALCPPAPTVASTATIPEAAPAPSARNSIASFKRTETWPEASSCDLPCRPSGLLLSAIHAHTPQAAGSTLFGLDPQTIECVQILFAERRLDLVLVSLEVPDFQVRQVPHHRHFTL